MIQTGLIQNAHSDLVTDASYDYYGLRLATCSIDQRIKIWRLDESNGTWNVEDDWKAHDASVSRVSWAHPEFGTILASCSFDRTVKVWEQVSPAGAPEPQPQLQPPPTSTNGTSNTGAAALQQHPSTSSVGSTGLAPSTSRWVERAVLTDARGTIRAVEFAPHHFGLKLATISSDNQLRIYECLEQPSLTTWQLSEELDVHSLPSGTSPSVLSRAYTAAVATPTQSTGIALDNASSSSLVAQALQQQLQQQQQQQQQQQPGQAPPGSRFGSGLGNREADGGWCISWCKDKYWGELIATGCGTSGIIKIIQLSSSRRPTTILTLDPSPSRKASGDAGAGGNSAALSAPLSSAPATATGTGQNAGAAAGTTTTASGAGALGGQGGDGDHAVVGMGTIASSAVTSVSWAPSCGRSYHLIATGGRDGRVRIWRARPPEERENDEEGSNDEDEEDEDEGRWTASVVADFDDHKSAVGRVEWNITGTVLSSAGNDGKIRLWKATSGSVWRSAGYISVEQAENENGEQDKGDVDMAS